MDSRVPNHRRWLEAERSGRDEAAELEFARLFAEVSAIEPSADFVGKAVQAAWRAHARRRLMLRVARVAAALVIAVAAVASMSVFGLLIVNAAVRGTVAVSHGLVWILTFAGEGLRWWSLAGRVGTAVGQTIAAPQTTTLIVAIELAGAMAIYAFQRVLRDERLAHDSQEAGT